MDLERIAVVGCGGVGGYYGGKLCQLLPDQGLRLSMIARGRHLAAIQSQGLILNTENEGRLRCQPSEVTDSVESLRAQDVILLCVKEFDLDHVLKRLRSAIQANTVILPLLNGVDIYERIRRRIDQGIVLPACVYVGTHIEAPGIVTQKGGACKILYGPDPSRPEFDPTPLIELFDRARILAQWTPTVQSAIWEKFLFICSFGLVTAAYGRVIGEVMEDDVLSGRVRAIMQEILSVADHLRVSLAPGIEGVAFEKATTFPYETKTSFQRDFEQAVKPDERALFAGSMLDYGKRFGIELPAITKVAQLLDNKKPLK